MGQTWSMENAFMYNGRKKNSAERILKIIPFWI